MSCPHFGSLGPKWPINPSNPLNHPSIKSGIIGLQFTTPWTSLRKTTAECIISSSTLQFCPNCFIPHPDLSTCVHHAQGTSAKNRSCRWNCKRRHLLCFLAAIAELPMAMGMSMNAHRFWKSGHVSNKFHGQSWALMGTFCRNMPHYAAIYCAVHGLNSGSSCMRFHGPMTCSCIGSATIQRHLDVVP